METLQREIRDERKDRFLNNSTSVGSIGVLGFSPGLKTSSSPLHGPYLVSRHEPSILWDVGRRWLPVEHLRRGPFATRTTAQPHLSKHRNRELEWRRTHSETLIQYQNEWVVLEEEEIIAHGPDAAQVIGEAKARGIGRPYVFFVEKQNENVITIGL